MWKPINGYFHPYRINEEAEVEWLNPKTDEWVRIKPFMVRGKRDISYGHLCVRMKTESGRFKNVHLKTLVIDAFFGGKKDGVVYGFKNGSITDCAIYNLYPTTQEEVSGRAGGHLRRSIEKIDRQGNVLDLYSSITEASKKNFMSRKSVTIRCQNKVKDPFELTGFSFRYEDRSRGGRR